MLYLPYLCSLQGVTAVACMSDSRHLVSGGGEGQVRVWEISDRGQVMKEALKEHKGTVTCIKIRSDDSEVYTIPRLHI